MAKTVATITDLSGLGKCSLTAALPVLAALGVQACPMPTAVLSAQTLFSGFAIEDLTGLMPKTARHWAALGMDFDGIYSGFLSHADQIQQVADCITQFGQGAHILVDPILGDDGLLYPTSTKKLCDGMGELVTMAHTITPNLTEACVLAGRDLGSIISHKGEADYMDRVLELAQILQAKGPQTVAITGIVTAEGDIANLVLSPEGWQSHRTPHLAGSFSGTGDLFASVLCGCLVQGVSAHRATDLACQFIRTSIHDTDPAGDPRQGIEFEKNLPILWEAISSCKSETNTNI